MEKNEIYSKEEVAKRLVATREALQLNQKDFAKRAGISPQQLNDWEAGRHRLSLTGALKIHDSFGVDPNWLFLNILDKLPHNVAVAVSSKSSNK